MTIRTNWVSDVAGNKHAYLEGTEAERYAYPAESNGLPWGSRWFTRDTGLAYCWRWNPAIAALDWILEGPAAPGVVTTLWVDPNGEDDYPGTEGMPLRNIPVAYQRLARAVGRLAVIRLTNETHHPMAGETLTMPGGIEVLELTSTLVPIVGAAGLTTAPSDPTGSLIPTGIAGASDVFRPYLLEIVDGPLAGFRAKIGRFSGGTFTLLNGFGTTILAGTPVRVLGWGATVGMTDCTITGAGGDQFWSGLRLELAGGTRLIGTVDGNACQLAFGVGAILATNEGKFGWAECDLVGDAALTLLGPRFNTTRPGNLALDACTLTDCSPGAFTNSNLGLELCDGLRGQVGVGTGAILSGFGGAWRGSDGNAVDVGSATATLVNMTLGGFSAGTPGQAGLFARGGSNTVLFAVGGTGAAGSGAGINVQTASKHFELFCSVAGAAGDVEVGALGVQTHADVESIGYVDPATLAVAQLLVPTVP